MGNLLLRQDKRAEAEPYIREALEKRLLVLGDDHPDTLTSMDNMAELLWAQHKYSEAEPYTRETLEKRRRVLGDEHPDTLESITGVGCQLWSLGKLSEAEPYLREAMEKRRRVLGDEHPHTLISINNMGLLLQAQAMLPEAEPMRMHVRHSRGPDAQARLAEAEPYMREALKGLRRVLGDDHPHTIGRIHNLGSLLRDQGRLSEAEELFAETVRRARRALPGNWLIGKYLMRHAQTLAALQRFEQAQVEMVEAQEILAAVLGPADARTNVSITALAELYEAWHAAEPDKGNDAKAAEWREKLPLEDTKSEDSQENDRQQSPP
jgi:tetratricopeptide (TPR) repeat protein